MTAWSNDPTLDPALRSWVPVPVDTDFPIQNLPFGVFEHLGRAARVGVAVGDEVLDLQTLVDAGLFANLAVALPAGVFAGPSLNPLLKLGRPAWRAVRHRLSRLLRDGDRSILDVPGLADRALIPATEVELRLPFEVGDYVDFYSSIEHASNMGRMFRPDTEPLLPNWRHLPVGYHGRSGSVVVGGTPVVRPRGQTVADDPPPTFGPTAQLDIELEMGFVVGPGSALGAPIPIGRTGEHVFGMVLVNDWSARDIQRWEYQPLGPFLGKSFATSISPWVVTLDALEPYRVAGPDQDPAPLPYLRTEELWAFDVDLWVELSTDDMSRWGTPLAVISRTNFRGMYWTVAQQLAHATSNGANVRPGDLFASGTISGPTPDSFGSLIELTWRGTRPITLPDGSQRTFLEDGDTVTIRGRCEAEGKPTIGFGEVRGTILPARQP